MDADPLYYFFTHLLVHNLLLMLVAFVLGMLVLLHHAKKRREKVIQKVTEEKERADSAETRLETCTENLSRYQAQAQNAQKKLEQDLQSLKKEKENLSSKIEERGRILGTLRKNITQMEEEKGALGENYTSCLNEFNNKNGEIQNLNDHLKSAEGQLATHHSKMQEMEERIQTQEHDKSTLLLELEKTKDIIHDFQTKRIPGLLEQKETFEQELELLQKTKITLQEKINELNTKVEEAEKKAEEAEKSKLKMEQQLQAVEEEKANLQTRLEEKDSVMHDYESSRVPTLERKCEEFQKAKDVLLEKLETCAQTQQKTAEQVRQLQEQLKEKDSLLAAQEKEQASQNTHRSLQYFKQEAGKVRHDRQFGFVYNTKPEQSDDLMAINGVGEVLQHRLNSFGVYTYRQIAIWSDSVIEEFSKRLSFKDRIARDNWIEQAKLLHFEKYSETVD